jgi:hypothetical protein
MSKLYDSATGKMKNAVFLLSYGRLDRRRTYLTLYEKCYKVAGR